MLRKLVKQQQQEIEHLKQEIERLNQQIASQDREIKVRDKAISALNAKLSKVSSRLCFVLTSTEIDALNRRIEDWYLQTYGVALKLSDKLEEGWTMFYASHLYHNNTNSDPIALLAFYARTNGIELATID
jgi:predicted RNase H-like nuclease (RuvC/YqgF family)